jgi:hypothetical protein
LIRKGGVDVESAVLDSQELRRVAAQEKAKNVLVRMSAHNRKVEHHTARVAEAVLEARNSGYSWTQIGEALGVSKQAVLQRFGPGGRYDVETNRRPSRRQA